MSNFKFVPIVENVYIEFEKLKLGYSISNSNSYYQGFILNLITKRALGITNPYLPVIGGTLSNVNSTD